MTYVQLFTEINYMSIYPVTATVLPKRPLWSSDQSSWLQAQRSRVRFPSLSDFLSSNVSGTGSNQPYEDK
jgi:hypothetical protein